MSMRQREGDDTGATTEAPAPSPQEAEPAPQVSGFALEEFLPSSAAPAPAPPAPGVRTARVQSVTGRRARIVFRGATAPIDAVIPPEVDPGVVEDALTNKDAVLVELVADEAPIVVAVLQTQRPREIRLKAATVLIEGEHEVLLRSGKGAIRIREDGDIEIVGSRISAASRGLFRLVGRILRLN
jgi:hypothetical protein